MVITIAVPGQVSTTDTPVYLRYEGLAGMIPSDVEDAFNEPPPPLPEKSQPPGAAPGAAGPSREGDETPAR